jgi:GNAT superfamily N-acetyltransferase
VGDEVTIHLAGPTDCAPLTAFFGVLAADLSVREFFHPHPFTADQAEWICTRGAELSDQYFVATEGDPENIVGYAMLRGWDEGFETPAFGVCVRPDRQGRGLGRRLLKHAIGPARDAGARRVMLKVHRDNSAARVLYESEGFVFAPGQESEQVVGEKDLA